MKFSETEAKGGGPLAPTSRGNSAVVNPLGLARVSLLDASFLLLLLLVCYGPTIWATGGLLLHSEDMAHGFFAPIVAGYILWHQRQTISASLSDSSPWGVVAIGVGGVIAIAATLGNSTTVSRIGLVVSLAGCLLLLGSASLLKALRFPLFLLLFTFPLPSTLYGEITLPLQLLASRLAELMFEGLGLSVLRDGNILELTHQRLSVVEACSGLRSLVTLSFFCIVYAYLLERNNGLRLLVLAAAVPSAIFINALRITATGILGKYDPALTKGTAHDITGWVCFAIGFALVLLTHLLAKRVHQAMRSRS